MMDATNQTAIRYATSMEVFADGEPTFKYGWWRDWKNECAEAGKMIPPAEFKARKEASRHEKR